MENEIWKDIPGYDGYYQISNLGRTKSKERFIITKDGVKRHIKEKIVSPSTSTGYAIIFLYKDGGRKCVKLHKLVAESFLDKTNFKYCVGEDINSIKYDDLEINHIDENKLNNKADNLEWCTSKYNCNYGNRTEIGHQKSRKKVNQRDKNGNLIKTWNDRKEASKALGISISNISHACKKRQKTAGGYIWEYADDNNMQQL